LCGKCGLILYEGDELKPPYEILEVYGRKCPKCRKELALFPLTVDISIKQ